MVASTSPAWTSDRLYRVVSDEGESGQVVEVDGWDDVLEAAWQQLIASTPEVSQWFDDDRERCGDESLIVSFGDSTRVIGRRADGYFGVSYPADRLLAAVRAVELTHSSVRQPQITTRRTWCLLNRPSRSVASMRRYPAW